MAYCKKLKTEGTTSRAWGFVESEKWPGNPAFQRPEYAPFCWYRSEYGKPGEIRIAATPRPRQLFSLTAHLSKAQSPLLLPRNAAILVIKYFVKTWSIQAKDREPVEHPLRDVGVVG